MPGIENLLYLVVYVLVLGLLVYAVTWLLNQMKLPEPIRWVLLAILAILALLFLLRQLGLL